MFLDTLKLYIPALVQYLIFQLPDIQNFSTSFLDSNSKLLGHYLPFSTNTQQIFDWFQPLFFVLGT